MFVHELADGLHTIPAGLRMTEEAPGFVDQLVRSQYRLLVAVEHDGRQRIDAMHCNLELASRGTKREEELSHLT